MRYENPLYMAEDAGAADVIAGGRLQLGVSRGSPEQVIDGWRYFGYAPPEGMTDADMAKRHTEVLLEVLRGEGLAHPNPQPMFPNPPGLLRVNRTRRACAIESGGRRFECHRRLGGQTRDEFAEFNTQKMTRADVRSTYSRRSRSGYSVKRGRRPVTRASRGYRSAAASLHSSTTATVPILGAGTRTRILSASSATTHEPFLAAATPPNRTSSSSNSRKTKPSQRLTHCS